MSPAPAGEDAVATAPPAPTQADANSSAATPPEASHDPLLWGVVGLNGYATGTHEASNGLAFDPLLALSSDLNFGLLPQKRLYLFLQDRYWVQRTATAATGVSQRELDANFGLSWDYFDALELRAFAYSLNNFNRGTSLAEPNGYQDGIGVENRYYFGSSDAYDIGRLSFAGIGYYPTKSFVGNNGESFRPGLFAHGYVTRDLSTPFRSYLYGGVQLTAENAVTPRLLDADFGIAFRPIGDRQSFELRFGDGLTGDLQAHSTRNLVYGAVRLGLGIDGGADSSLSGGPGSTVSSSWPLGWPEIWGVVGLPVYATGSRMAPNGVAFDPIFAITSELKLGLIPQRRFYLFWEGNFWAQHSGVGITNSGQGSFDFSKREFDSNTGIAWNFFESFELRGSYYALNNLNRGTSQSAPTGGKQGAAIEDRYYFSSPNPYDVGRSSFVGLGYTPTENLIGGNGASFRPGPFARAYLARDLPISWLSSYLYAGLQVTTEQPSELRLYASDVGWAVRPFARWQNVEFRVGDQLTADVDAGATRNLVYGAVRLEFSPGPSAPSPR